MNNIKTLFRNLLHRVPQNVSGWSQDTPVFDTIARYEKLWHTVIGSRAKTRAREKQPARHLDSSRALLKHQRLCSWMRLAPSKCRCGRWSKIQSSLTISSKIKPSILDYGWPSLTPCWLILVLENRLSTGDTARTNQEGLQAWINWRPFFVYKWPKPVLPSYCQVFMHLIFVFN